MRNELVNTYLQYVNNRVRRILPFLGHKINKSKYTLAYHSNITDIEDENCDWRKGMWYGDFSTKETTEYFHPDMVDVHEGLLRLRTEIRPKYNKYNDTTMKYARGIMMTNFAITDFKYIEVETKNEIVPDMWAAPLWFVAAGDDIIDKYFVLPEIDVCELYTGTSKKFKKKVSLETNLHYGTDYRTNPKSMGAMPHRVKKVHNTWIRYGVEIKGNIINFYYNDYLVRSIRDKKIVDRLKYGMYAVINNGVKRGTVDHDKSSMYVRNFKIYK